MSITLNLEVASGIGIDEIKGALTGLVCSDISDTDNGFTALFPNTNVSISVNTELEDTSVFTEDLEEVEWKVGLRMYFDIDPTLPNALEDVRKFILNLSNQTPFEFALSFQYETLYAKKDIRGLVLSDDTYRVLNKTGCSKQIASRFKSNSV